MGIKGEEARRTHEKQIFYIVFQSKKKKIQANLRKKKRGNWD